MKGDFTRFTFDPKKHYSGVFKQQGRVDLDADWNEYVEMQDHLGHIRAKDIIGPCGVPISCIHGSETGGFSVSVDDIGELHISPGRIYVDGILCELESSIAYQDQADYQDCPRLDRKGTDLVYLDVWQRNITAIEDPKIRDTALGGPDTTTRVKIVWQVKVQKVEASKCCDVPPLDQIPSTKPSGGLLSTLLNFSGDSTNPCLPISDGKYSGLENRLYRIEIHDGGEPYRWPDPQINPASLENIAAELAVDREEGIFVSSITGTDNLADSVATKGTATFKWSRDNGSVVFPIEEFPLDKKIIKLKRLGRDQVLTLHSGDWVEVLDDVTEYLGKPGTMAQIVDEPDQAGFTITLSKEISGYDINNHAKVRRWDQRSDVIDVNTISPADLEDGIRIQFSGNNFKTGDYWVFAARTTGEFDTLVSESPNGIKHHYCKLALVKWTEDGPNGESATVIDCRRKFRPLTELGSDCCTVTVGDGVNSHGDFDDLQKAVDSVIKFGGLARGSVGAKVCILPGTHRLSETVYIGTNTSMFIVGYEGTKFSGPRMIIRGCGEYNTTIVGPENGEPAFIFEGDSIQLSSLAIMVGVDQCAIEMKNCCSSKINNILILDTPTSTFFPNLRDEDELPLVADLSDEKTTEGKNPADKLTELIDKLTELISISYSCEIAIEDNKFYYYNPNRIAYISLNGTGITLARNELIHATIWIKDRSRGISVSDNRIKGIQDYDLMLSSVFSGPGIILGGLDKEDLVTSSSIYDTISEIYIGRNNISLMGDSGISTINRTDQSENLYDIVIDQNSIVGCVRGNPYEQFDNETVGGIVIKGASRVSIRGNYIAKNAFHTRGACGIFVKSCNGLEVTGNTIIDNGSMFYEDLDARYEFDALNGDIKLEANQKVFQAGIVAINIVGSDLPAYSLDNQPTDTLAIHAGMPSAIISNNIVVAPSGHALILTGLGHMLISNNSLTSLGYWPQPLNYLKGNINYCVCILNFGLSQTLVTQNLLQEFKNFYQYLVFEKEFRDFYQYLGFEKEFKDFYQDLGFEKEFNGFFQYLGNEFEETISKMESLNFPYGPILFHGNQVTFQKDAPKNEHPIERNFLVKENLKNIIGSCIFIASGDDVSFQDNQITSMIKGKLLFSNVVTVSPTVRANGNLFSEILFSTETVSGALFSYFSVGAVNAATNNQAINCIYVRSFKKSPNLNNQIYQTEEMCKELNNLFRRNESEYIQPN